MSCNAYPVLDAFLEAEAEANAAQAAVVAAQQAMACVRDAVTLNALNQYVDPDAPVAPEQRSSALLVQVWLLAARIAALPANVRTLVARDLRTPVAVAYTCPRVFEAPFAWSATAANRFAVPPNAHDAHSYQVIELCLLGLLALFVRIAVARPHLQMEDMCTTLYALAAEIGAQPVREAARVALLRADEFCRLFDAAGDRRRRRYAGTPSDYARVFVLEQCAPPPAHRFAAHYVHLPTAAANVAANDDAEHDKEEDDDDALPANARAMAAELARAVHGVLDDIEACVAARGDDVAAICAVLAGDDHRNNTDGAAHRPALSPFWFYRQLAARSATMARYLTPCDNAATLERMLLVVMDHSGDGAIRALAKHLRFRADESNPFHYFFERLVFQLLEPGWRSRGEVAPAYDACADRYVRGAIADAVRALPPNAAALLLDRNGELCPRRLPDTLRNDLDAARRTVITSIAKVDSDCDTDDDNDDEEYSSMRHGTMLYRYVPKTLAATVAENNRRQAARDMYESD